MLNRMVPTPLKTLPATKVLALTAKTSESGRLNEMSGVQFRASVSRHWEKVGLNLSRMPISGAAAPKALVEGGATPPGAPGICAGQGPAKPSQTASALIAVVRLPEWNAATKTVSPVALRASARGVSEKKVRIR